MNEEIRHEGVVQRVDGEHVTVRIVQTSACLHCKIASHCNSADSKEKIVDVWTDKASMYSVGQKVSVCMGGKLGLTAVFWAFVLPVLIAFVVIYVSMMMTAPDGIFPLPKPFDEGAGAIGGLVTFVVYYSVLYLFRDSLKRKYRFRIE